MDSTITAAGVALTRGDALQALNLVALRNDPAALALRGIAMAQLGDLQRARALVRLAGKAFGDQEPLSQARCVLAEAEIALAMRDLKWPARRLVQAHAVLAAHGDSWNLAQAAYLEVRRLALGGRIEAAQAALEVLEPPTAPALVALHHLILGSIALRRLRASAAHRALQLAQAAATAAGIRALLAEVQGAQRLLHVPAARCRLAGQTQFLSMAEVEVLRASPVLIVDACRRCVGQQGAELKLARRPLLFGLLRVLAQAWPADVAREVLIEQGFHTRHGNETHRARLRVELGRLRALLRPFACLLATPAGFQLLPHHAVEVRVLDSPVDHIDGALLGLLNDGQAWSSSALAVALDASQRKVQRALEALAADGRVRAVGQGRARRWLAPAVPAFATALLLSGPLLKG